LRRLAPDIYAYTQASGPGVDNASLSNAGLIVGPESMLAIDTLGPPVHAKAFRAAATQATGKPFGRVVNTHHHRDHTNGNYLYVRWRSSRTTIAGRPRLPRAFLLARTRTGHSGRKACAS
jgi:glyoxylase-like metal-dependent hydrolase (beta-lactamase superfamily II)